MLSLDHITVSYGSRAVLHDISASIAPAQTTALMGPNGSGKTTLLRCMAGLQKPTEGKVLLGKEPIASLPARRLAQQLAVVPQQLQADLDFTAFDIVLMGRNPYLHPLRGESEADRNIAEQALRQTSTLHLRHFTPQQMSGGELQRVMIARALAQQTPLLLMDEPVSNLDIAHQIEIMRLLRTTGKTIVIVLHDLNLALHFCDRLLLLHPNGSLLYHGPTREGLSASNIRTAYGVDTHLVDNHLIIDL